MWGNPSHLAQLNRMIQEVKGSNDQDGVELVVLAAETNKDESTYDGVDWGGERVAKEILEEIEKQREKGKTVTRFSVTGYSLGGLVARYVIGILHQRGFFESVTPVNFNTLATPHIGIPRYASTFSSIFAYLGPKLLSRSGEQFFCVDKWSVKGRSLIEVMADPERIFYQALLLFPNIRIYANGINDMTVPYVTACIDAEDPFADYEENGIQVECHEEYKYLIKSYAMSESPMEIIRTPSPSVFSAEWFSNIKNSRPPLPPFLQRGFPLNIFLYALLPLLLPTFISLVLVRLSLAAHHSRSRLKSLEANSLNGETLIHIIAKLESQLEGAVAEFYDDPQTSPRGPSPALETPESKAKSKSKSHLPIFTPVQLRCIEHLNKIPQLKKERTFFKDVRNSHAIIVCRDINIKQHLEGEGILKHWADNFVL
ncbi:hypothetical protein SERLA73DRAFT_57876 [Serpula lacrymans var. lacrymans S7.3]|uniref:DUF676 domain-containing protein n=1 Tax=Serpula lacrymans var. lacrymans (strain S7.3) TaxID=936435 RepID=F8Q3Q3_SERL3|nr:hypothetical protein SERLA73DRAFT_57876 [Serpula lacrymans var. lacrymans S7.3]